MKFKFYPLALAALLAVQSCDDDNDGPSLQDQQEDAVEVYADIVYASYQDSYTTAVTLKEKIDAFVAAPSAAGLTECKNAWLAARTPYGQTEAYRFYGGPIDDEDGPEGLINAWPMDEAFVDYVEGNAAAGIINNADEFPTITKAVLEDVNETTETSISTGYHAIEFLLWGQDQNVDGPGNRPYTDYIAGAGGTAANQQRRGQYLKAAAELLLDNLASVRDEWAPGAAYREGFEDDANLDETLTGIFTGLAELAKGELAGERMLVAVENEDQEDEHSCFSDNTHNDIFLNFKGIKNMYYGSYTRVDGTVVSGTSFKDIVRSQDAAAADAVEAAFADAEEKIELIPVPFDQAIVTPASQDIVLDAVDSLSDLSDLLVDAAATLGVEF